MPGTNIINAAITSSLEGFVNPDDSAARKESYVVLASSLITFVIALIILSLVGKLLWNGVITNLFTCVRPATSFWQILGLFVFTSLLLG